MSLGLGHTASTYQENDGRWRAGCAQCGWFSQRTFTTHDRGARSAQRHVTDATARDQRTYQLLYGPKK